MASSGVLARHAEFLPVSAKTPDINLGEGYTPLVKSARLADVIGCAELCFKLEGCNPTGSFKDRGMVVAVAKAVEVGARVLICASTGNTSASAAAYAARAGLPAVVLIPDGKIALGKLAQAIMHGAHIAALQANFDAALRIVRILGEQPGVAVVNSINPFRIEGQKTAAFEVVEQLGAVPDILAIPVGNAGNITSYWKGFKELFARGKTRATPQMLGFQAAGAAPIVSGHVIANPETIATAIRIGNPASWAGAIAARDESGGHIEAVTDDEILEAYRLLAADGIFAEPASAASVAGVLKMAHHGKVQFSGKRVVCVITGTGLKDPNTAIGKDAPITRLPDDVDAIVEWLGRLSK